MWGTILSGINTGVNAMGGWGNVIQAGVGLYGAAKSKKGGKKAAGQAMEAATPYGYSTSGPFGSTYVDPRTRQMQFSLGQNPFAQLYNIGGLQSLGNAYTAPGSPYYGAAPEIAAAAEGLTGPALEQEAAGRLGILRQLAQPEEQRATTQLTDRLFASGRLGGTGGAVEQEAMQRAMSAADLQRQLASQDWAATRAQNRFQGALQAVGAGQGAQAQQFNIGQNSFQGLQGLYDILLRQGHLGLGAGAAAPPEMAALQYGANTAPGMWEAGMEWAKQRDVFGKIGDWIGGQWPGSTPPQTPQPMPGPGGYGGGGG